VNSYGLKDWGIGVRFTNSAGFYCTAFRPTVGPTLHSVHWVRQALHAGLEGDRPLTKVCIIAEVKNVWRHASTTPYVFMECCWMAYMQEQLYLYSMLGTMFDTLSKRLVEFLVVFWWHSGKQTGS